jgi:hypothetical protein
MSYVISFQEVSRPSSVTCSSTSKHQVTVEEQQNINCEIIYILVSLWRYDVSMKCILLCYVFLQHECSRVLTDDELTGAYRM